MSLVEELKMRSNEMAERNKAVENEIVEWFRERFASEDFAKSLMSHMSSDNIRDRKKSYIVEYKSFDVPHFYCCLEIWKNPESKPNLYSEQYKGVCLHDIYKNVCSRIVDLAQCYLKGLGLNVFCINDKSYGHSDYFAKEIVVTW